MKKWKAPHAEINAFSANSYISTCYEVSENGLWGPWKETNGVPGLQVTRHSKSKRYPDGCDADTEYTNLDGYQYIRTVVPQYATQANDGSFEGSKQDQNTVWCFMGIDGVEWYMLHSADASTESNHS